MNQQLSTLVIAEAGVNHNGKLDNAIALVVAAAHAGADVVKFQTFKAARLVTSSVDRARYQEAATNSRQSQLSMLEVLELSETDFQTLAHECAKRNITFMSTPFDETSADFLVQKLDQKTLKVGSGDLTNGPLLLHLARLRRPIILSTGMANLSDVEAALSVLAYGYTTESQPTDLADCQTAYNSSAGQQALVKNVTLLQCTTEYPAAPETINLRAMNTLSIAFGLPVGFSDHTKGVHISVAAVALGARVIEKHMTLDRKLPGPDHQASIEPDEFEKMVVAIRETEAALGNGIKAPHSSELANRAVVRRAVVAARPIAAGELLSTENITVKRASSGIAAFGYWPLLGVPASRAYDIDEQIDQ